MAPRKRNAENKPLPPRWRFRTGSYCYMVPPGLEHLWDGKKEFRLGRTLNEAYQTWAERLEYDDGTEISSFGDLAERYRLEVLTTLAPKTQESYRPSIARLLPTFQKTKACNIKPSHANRYYDLMSKQRSKAVAKGDVGVLRAILSAGVRWGVLDNNQLKGQLRLEGAGTRNRYVEDWEVDEALSLRPTSGGAKASGRGTILCQLYTEFKLMTGLRRGDILRLPVLDHDKPIIVQPNKTKKTSGKVLVIDWIDELHQVVRAIEAIPPRRIGNAPLICTRAGKSYLNEKTGRANGFDSMWQRFMARVVAETRVSEPFQEKDIRAKVGSDQDTIEQAAELLGHTNTATTAKSYRRKPTRITPRSRISSI